MAGPLPANASTDHSYPPLSDARNPPANLVNGHHNGEINSLGNGEHPTTYRHPYTPKDAPLENFRRIKVVVIGAGYSGIYYGIRIPERLRNVELTIYEKNDGVGGTWWENRYPGCACDIPAHSYQYSFDPNPHWSSFYAPSSEIRDYLNGIAEKYNTKRYMKLKHKVISCQWDNNKAKWRFMVENVTTGQTFDDESDILISARGGLNDPKWPDCEGLSDFKGKILHSAMWDEKYDFSNKKIGVIGGGSSAIQIIPNLQKLPGVRLSCFIRSKTWISPPFGDHAMEMLGLDHKDFTPEDYANFMSDPVQYQRFRKLIEADGNSIHGYTQAGSELQKTFNDTFTAGMRNRLSKKPEIADHLLPGFAVGCRRLTPGPGYLEALCEENVEFIKGHIARITPAGVELQSGRTIDLDVLVCATGFHTSAPPPFPLTGLNGKTMSSRFNPDPESYLSITIDPFPNFFMMLGPNSAIGSGSLTMMIESAGDYVIKAIRKIQKEDIRSMTIKPRRVRDFQEYADEYFKKTVYMDRCSSWYRSVRSGRVTGLWPGSTMHAIEALRSPRWEDYDYVYEGEQESKGDGEEIQVVQEPSFNADNGESGFDPSSRKRKRLANGSDDVPKASSIKGEANRLKWLGNGWSALQLDPNGDLAYYLEPEFTDVPANPYPEDTREYIARPFSY